MWRHSKLVRERKRSLLDAVIFVLNRGVATVFTVWLEQFPGDFDESPNYTCLNKMLNFVTSEMKACHGDELSRKIQHRLDKFQITPFEDQGKAFYHVLLGTFFEHCLCGVTPSYHGFVKVIVT